MSWPAAELDSIRRLRVLNARMPGTALAERVLDAPFDAVWDVIGEPERYPEFDNSLRTVRVVRRDGERLRIFARTVIGLGSAFDVEMQRGFCWMQSRLYVVGMAAVPDGDRTRYAHLEGVPMRGTRVLRPLLRLEVASDVRGVERVVRRAPGPTRG